MRAYLKNKLKQKIKKQAVNKGLNIIVTLIMTLAPGGMVGKMVKLIGSRWVLQYMSKKMAK
ncbi:hypothetical protein [Providencia sneebia]|uniref:Uncharacterized protein n=1 Tax=Providencia sneebia DSM 19967 TaxID=1141660 RepID=K8W9W7_9GAMM|nr:hypothetical protein [Providencia sneebia]EKT57428.1 hypothetical protein OO7_08565 [Providencia sneebia DSM 19967]